MRLPRRFGRDQNAELVEHLGELRARLAIALFALGVGFAIAYAFHHELVQWLDQPLGGRRPVTLGISEPFAIALKVSFYAGLVFALPVLLWQLWSFLAPAVDPGTERAIGGFVAFATALFASGVVFAYRIVLPAAIHYLTRYDSGLYGVQIRASSYYSFALLTLLVGGFLFQLPVAVLALVRIGVLSSARLRRNRRIGYFALAALALALPGVDPVTTALELLPLLALFELSIWLSVALERRWRVARLPAAR